MLNFQISETETYPLPTAENPAALEALIKLAVADGVKVACEAGSRWLEDYQAEDLVMLQKIFGMVAKEDHGELVAVLQDCLPFQAAVFHEYLQDYLDSYEFKLLKAVWNSQEFPSEFLNSQGSPQYYKSPAEFAKNYIEAGCESSILRKILMEKPLEEFAFEVIKTAGFTAFEVGDRFVVFE